MAIPTLGVTVLDCPDAGALARFYADLIGGTADVSETEDDWAEVRDPQGRRRLGFQTTHGYVPPQWPGEEHSQQLHLDFDVPRERLEEAEREVLALGATLLQSDEGKRNFRVYRDPVGHPFCLCFD